MRKLTVEDAIAHVTYLIENAKVTMPPGVPSWVFVFDCTGKKLFHTAENFKRRKNNLNILHPRTPELYHKLGKDSKKEVRFRAYLPGTGATVIK